MAENVIAYGDKVDAKKVSTLGEIDASGWAFVCKEGEECVIKLKVIQ